MEFSGGQMSEFWVQKICSQTDTSSVLLDVGAFVCMLRSKNLEKEAIESEMKIFRDMIAAKVSFPFRETVLQRVDHFLSLPEGTK